MQKVTQPMMLSMHHQATTGTVRHAHNQVAHELLHAGCMCAAMPSMPALRQGQLKSGKPRLSSAILSQFQSRMHWPILSSHLACTAMNAHLRFAFCCWYAHDIWQSPASRPASRGHVPVMVML